MSTKVNPIMVEAGYAPAKLVAEVLNKSVQTVHRMVQLGDITGANEGRVLYILLSSLEDFYADNAPMRGAVAKLRASAPAKKKKTA